VPHDRSTWQHARATVVHGTGGLGQREPRTARTGIPTRTPKPPAGKEGNKPIARCLAPVACRQPALPLPAESLLENTQLKSCQLAAAIGTCHYCTYVVVRAHDDTWTPSLAASVVRSSKVVNRVGARGSAASGEK